MPKCDHAILGALLASLIAQSPAAAQSVQTRRAAISDAAGSQPPTAGDRSAEDRSEQWWKHAVIYEIYPRSFADTNGDGVGDLNGITAHLDYLKALGVTAVWLTPMYPSPQADFGYDISDYEAVDPQYGTVADVDRLQEEIKKRGMHLILDMVLNHTSDQHQWFVESARSRTNAKADWYLWNDGIPSNSSGVTAFQKRYEHDGRVPPNNWASVFGGSAWEWVPSRKQFYYHRFYKAQPDLNWRNPAVEEAMFGAMRFWLDRGISGFRLDVIATLFEDLHLRNARETGGTNIIGEPNLNTEYLQNLPEVHGVLRRMRQLTDSYPGDRVLIGETYPPNTAALGKWYGTSAEPQLHLAMNTLLGFPKTEYTPAHFKPLLMEAAALTGEQWPLFVFDNHDFDRSIDRFGDGKHDIAIAKGIATILFGTQATAMTYYGAEIGMRTHTPTRKEDVRDPVGVQFWPIVKGRDGARTPMQWGPTANAGFSAARETWLPVPPDASTINVQTQNRDPDSLLNWHRTLIRLRASVPALVQGDTSMINSSNRYVLAWRRRAKGSEVLIAINMTNQTRTLAITEIGGRRLRMLAASGPGAKVVPNRRSVILPAFTSWIAEVD